jgi:protein-tyrosine-phosphatase
VDGSEVAIKTVLFVCYGNIARSLIAEGYMRKMVAEKNLETHVLSAGLNAKLPPPKETMTIINREHMNLQNRTSTQLTREMLNEADLILTMEQAHKKAILLYYPQIKNKVFTLKEFAGETKDLDIKDPYGKGLETYEACAEEIESIIRGSFEKIVIFLGV